MKKGRDGVDERSRRCGIVFRQAKRTSPSRTDGPVTRHDDTNTTQRQGGRTADGRRTGLTEITSPPSPSPAPAPSSVLRCRASDDQRDSSLPSPLAAICPVFQFPAACRCEGITLQYSLHPATHVTPAGTNCTRRVCGTPPARGTAPPPAERPR